MAPKSHILLPTWYLYPECLILSQLRVSQTEHFIPLAPKYNSPLRVHITSKSITIQPLSVLLPTSNSRAHSVDSAQNVPHMHPLPSNSVPITLIHASSISSLAHNNLPTASLLPALPSSYTTLSTKRPEYGLFKVSDRPCHSLLKSLQWLF